MSAKNETKILKFCSHPNIVSMLDSFESLDNIYIVMEYMKEGDLLSFLRNSRVALTECMVSNIVFQVASSINYLHQCGIIHRDLKLENILIKTYTDKSFLIKIGDFGLSAVTSPSQDAAERHGTLHYLAPEILELKSYDCSVDIWSLGVITYTLISGAFPFDDIDEAALTRYNL